MWRIELIISIIAFHFAWKLSLIELGRTNTQSSLQLILTSFIFQGDGAIVHY